LAVHDAGHDGQLPFDIINVDDLILNLAGCALGLLLLKAVSNLKFVVTRSDS
jgi:glycopeptide antibiotics resistance protein